MNVLITGPSGSGKSTIGKILQKRGYNFVEADVDKYKSKSIAYYINKKTGEGVNMPWPRPKDWGDENDWVWRVDIIKDKLAQWPNQVNFVCGDAANKQEAYQIFDKIIVLSTDDSTLRQRVLSRKNNYFGKDSVEFAWISEQNKKIYEEAKHASGIIIDASKPVNEIVDEIISLVGK